MPPARWERTPQKSPQKGSGGKSHKNFPPCWLRPLDSSALLEADEIGELFERENVSQPARLPSRRCERVPSWQWKVIKKKRREKVAERVSLR